ncbi:MAG TPA: RNA 2',3'-cyclic phosphodiesterase, partial [Steroidobacteraceae bacterium]|nr:RNA 2',3'-cyclic phosphodiesterase [Steroidobacteraceae bacterium]
MNDPFLPEELRLFIAVELPEAWRQALRTAERELERAGLGGLRWVRPEAIHLTLKFLGEVGRHMLGDIETAMAAACGPARAFELQLTALGSFAGRGRVRVLWAGVEGDLAALRGVQQRLDAEVHGLGFARETRPFAPHLTLARVADDAPHDLPARVTAALRAVKLPAVDPFQVQE